VSLFAQSLSPGKLPHLPILAPNTLSTYPTVSPGPELTLSLDLSYLSLVSHYLSGTYPELVGLSLLGEYLIVSPDPDLILILQSFHSCKLPLLLEYLTISPGPELLL
jgi:hypothetical protein